MTLKEVSSTCERYHKTHMFSWLIAHVLLMRVQDVLERTKEYQKRLPQIIEFCSHLDLKSLQSLIIAVACSSPGKFSEVFFRNRPEFSVYEGSLREPWRLYLEQWEATEYKGDLLVVGGAGSGKTRLFCNIGLSVLAFNRASVLVVTHSETARDQIFGEMLYQVENSSFLSSLFPPKLITHGNNKVIRCSKKGYGKIRFCLSLKGHSIWGVQIGRGC